jgi:hypothetical protein
MAYNLWNAQCLKYSLLIGTIIHEDLITMIRMGKYQMNLTNKRIILNYSSLIFDAKNLGKFWFERWGKDYKPDFSFTTSNDVGQTPPIRRIVQNNFSRSQHHPIVINIGIQIPIVNSIQKPRKNFQYTNWNSYTCQLDGYIRCIKPMTENYDQFKGLVRGIGKKHISRGHRKYYVVK